MRSPRFCVSFHFLAGWDPSGISLCAVIASVTFTGSRRRQRVSPLVIRPVFRWQCDAGDCCLVKQKRVAPWLQMDFRNNEPYIANSQLSRYERCKSRAEARVDREDAIQHRSRKRTCTKTYENRKGNCAVVRREGV